MIIEENQATAHTSADDPEPVNVLLQGIVGSTAYGLATPDSDIDRLGVFAAPTVALHRRRSDTPRLRRRPTG